MSDYAADAVERFHAGASCAQAVLAACAPALGLTEAMAMRMGSALGAGLAGLRETCGAVTAMATVLGLRYGAETPMDAQTKAAHYARVRAAIAAFEAEFGTHNCKALLQKASIEKQAGVAPEARTATYYAQRPCAAFVRFCAARAMAEDFPQP